jgi:PAS domain S-box-containing protein
LKRSPDPTCEANGIDMKAKSIAILILLFISIPTHGDEPVILKIDELKGQEIGLHVEYLEDREKRWNIDDVLKDDVSSGFKKSDKRVLNFGYTTKSAYWLRFKALNPTSENIEWYLDFDYPSMDEIELYIPDEKGGFIVKKAGDLIPFHEREIEHRTFVFPMLSKPGTSTYYMRINNRGVKKIPLRIWSKNELYSHMHTDTMIYGIFFGILILAFFYNMFIFIKVKQISYLYLSIHILTSILLVLSKEMHGYQYLWPNTIWMTYFALLFLPLMFISSILFVRSFLETAHYTPRIDKALLLYLALLIIIVGLFPILSFERYLKALITLMLVRPLRIVLTIIAAIIVLRRGLRAGKYFLIASAIYSLLGYMEFFEYIGIVPHYLLASLGHEIGLSAYIVILSLGLADRINTLNIDLKKEITEHRRAEDTLRVSEERLFSFMDSASDSFYLLDADLNFVEINKRGLELIGKGREEIIGKHITDIVPDVKESGRYEKHLEVMRTGEPFVVEDFVPHPIFGDLHFILKSFKVGDGLGVIASDITDRKLAEEQIRTSLKEKEILLKEIHHRVKNNLQIMSSIIDLQARSVEEEEARKHFKDCRNRIQSMALIHGSLYSSGELVRINFNNYTRNLILQLIHSYQSTSKEIEQKINVDDIHLDIDTAVPCALIMNEMITNSLIHAFPTGRGEISVDFKHHGEVYRLIISDNGRGLPEELDFKNTKTLGLYMVRILTKQICGDLELDRTSGTRFTLTFPERSHASYSEEAKRDI